MLELKSREGDRDIKIDRNPVIKTLLESAWVRTEFGKLPNISYARIDGNDVALKLKFGENDGTINPQVFNRENEPHLFPFSHVSQGHRHRLFYDRHMSVPSLHSGAHAPFGRWVQGNLSHCPWFYRGCGRGRFSAYPGHIFPSFEHGAAQGRGYMPRPGSLGPCRGHDESNNRGRAFFLLIRGD